MSRRWRELLNDDITWKNLCEKHAYSVRRITEEDDLDLCLARSESKSETRPSNNLQRRLTASNEQSVESAPELPRTLSGEWLPQSSYPSRRRRARPVSYRSQFKQKYMVESAWNKGGRCAQRHITPDQGVVTSLHLTPKYIVVALDNAKIHVYDTYGDNQKTLQGHVMGVWAMVPWDDILVSGGCDREVRVWNMATG